MGERTMKLCSLLSQTIIDTRTGGLKIPSIKVDTNELPAALKRRQTRRSAVCERVENDSRVRVFDCTSWQFDWKRCGMRIVPLRPESPNILRSATARAKTKRRLCKHYYPLMAWQKE